MMGKKDVRYVAWKDEEKYMYCGNCGKKIKDGEKKCTFCGYEQEIIPQWKGLSLDFVEDEEKENPSEKPLKPDKDLSDTKSGENVEIFFQTKNPDSPSLVSQDAKRKLKQKRQKTISNKFRRVTIGVGICLLVLILLNGIYIGRLQNKNNNLTQKLGYIDKLQDQIEKQDKRFDAMVEKQKVQDKKIKEQKEQIKELQDQINKITQNLQEDTSEEDYFDTEDMENEKTVELTAIVKKILEDNQEVTASDENGQEEYIPDEQ